MNKQEAIELLRDVAQRVFYRTGRRSVHIDKIVELVNQIDEPQKPVVPKFVADLYEEIKDDFENKVYDLCVRFDSVNCKLSSEVWGWFDWGKNEPIQTLVKMKLYGYEIEKEKLYTVEIPNPNSAGVNNVLFKQQSTGRLILGMLNPNIDKPKYLHLTESEIKKDFEWAWDAGFAKEVEDMQ